MIKSMRQTYLFTKTRKEAPSDEVAKNAELLLRAGFINKELAGVYSYLPLGLKVVKKIESIIREEMDAIGGQEIVLPSLQDKATWEPTNQWDDGNVDIWFKSKLKNETEVGFGWSHEAVMTKTLKNFMSSYKELPKLVYQFQTKFRNETRAKSGIMRTREFVMKDLYSFARDEKEHEEIYNKVKEAYKNIFKRAGIGHLTYYTYASGGVFSDFSHEFQTLTGAGEDTIYVDEDKSLAINKEVYTDKVIAELGLDKDSLTEHKAVEVGNIFPLGTRFSEALDLKYQTENGDKKPVIMGSYGIGLGRLMGTIAEVLSDDKGLIWPESIAPFKVHLLSLGSSAEVRKEADKLYETLGQKGVEVLFDDREEASAGEKFADSDLIGIPFRVVVSERSIQDGGFEVKKRTAEKGDIVTEKEILELLDA